MKFINKNLIFFTIMILFSELSSASLVTTKIEGQFLLGTVISLNGQDITYENLEASGDAFGLGSSDIEFAVGICDPNFPPPDGCGGATSVERGGESNKLSFDGLGLREGGIPTDSFLVGEFTFANNDITWDSFVIQSLFLEVSAIECDLFGENCDESTRHSGTTELTFAFTANDPNDLSASADSVCLKTELGLGDDLCAWVPEFSSESFEIYGRFGSLIVEDIVPSSADGFVTIGTDSSQNIKYSATAIPEPSGIALIGLSCACLFQLSRKQTQITNEKP
ncbi:hypothetical protein [uncultured Paraglaciecola sp.]|uniref:hypothetical protein n=1 Tax=uncultured Paraglaciecola sp. TaxID=1765024 RepID=UPI0025998F77|nr:hypothetical protein [uncultured Paraglaciecola sp.]